MVNFITGSSISNPIKANGQGWRKFIIHQLLLVVYYILLLSCILAYFAWSRKAVFGCLSIRNLKADEAVGSQVGNAIIRSLFDVVSKLIHPTFPSHASFPSAVIGASGHTAFITQDSPIIRGWR